MLKGECMSGSLKLSVVLPVAPETLYKAWLTGKEHTAFTGSPAKASTRIGGTFSAWEGYISGKNLKLTPNRTIVQSWRTTEFPEDAPDSKLEVILEKAAKGTRLTLIHTEIPAGQTAEYKKGWKEFYFDPMTAYFAKKRSR
jgi:activator of HSP90 ATPase